MTLHKEMMDKADKVADYYDGLQQKLFMMIVDASKDTRNLLTDSNHLLDWRLKMLSKMGGLTQIAVRMVAKSSGKTQKAINDIIKNDGLKVANDISAELGKALTKKVSVSPEVKTIIDGYAHQTFKDIDNNVNQTLLSTNYDKNPAMKAYQDIINQTVLEAQTGLKTPEKALADNVYKWRDAGLKSAMVDKGGHQWSLDGYTRTVITSTAHRTFNDVRLQSMKDFDSVLAVMDSHAAARPACANIQGKVVNVVPMSDERADQHYDSIYNHGYGTAAGTQGINCRHILYPYIEGVSHNYQDQVDPEEAVKNAETQQRQRALERRVRADKNNLQLAEKLGDQDGVNHYKGMLSNHRSALRDLVKEHDFLHRDYSREKVYGWRPTAPRIKPVEKVVKPIEIPKPVKPVEPKPVEVKTTTPKPVAKKAPEFKDEQPNYSKLTTGNFTKKDTDVIANYYHGDAYEINDDLRHDEPLSSNPTSEELSKIIGRNVTKKPIKLYRKVNSGEMQQRKNRFIAEHPENGMPEFKVGDTYEDKGFTSASKSTNQDRFKDGTSGFEGDTEVIIDVPKGAHALDIQPIADEELEAGRLSEQEVILQHGSKFKVEKITYRKLEFPISVGRDLMGNQIVINRVKQVHLKLILSKK